MCFNVFWYGKTHASYIFHIKKHSVLLPEKKQKQNCSFVLLLLLVSYVKQKSLLQSRTCSTRSNYIFAMISIKDLFFFWCTEKFIIKFHKIIRYSLFDFCENDKNGPPYYKWFIYFIKFNINY
jgi:hypothetical protein